jgi:hypothetical protein
MTPYIIRYNHSGDDDAPDFLDIVIEADSPDEALEKFEQMGIYHGEAFVVE